MMLTGPALGSLVVGQLRRPRVNGRQGPRVRVVGRVVRANLARDTVTVRTKSQGDFEVRYEDLREVGS